MPTVLNKLEIDVMQQNELNDASSIAFKYCLPSIVVIGSLSGEAIFTRGRMGGRYKIITPIDWPKGEVKGVKKMQGVSIDSLDTDGFEFYISGHPTAKEAALEIESLTKFVDERLGPNHDCRFVVGSYSRSPEVLQAIYDGFSGRKTPAMIRNDVVLKAQVGKVNISSHMAFINDISTKIKAPYKVAGNINSYRAMSSCFPAANCCGVSLQQAKTIIREMQAQPQEVKDLVNQEDTNND